MTIFQWDDIEAEFHHGLLLGNGARVAVDSGFSYGSHFDEGTSLGHITAPVQDIFDRFITNDFLITTKAQVTIIAIVGARSCGRKMLKNLTIFRPREWPPTLNTCKN